jgi:hypothetical protein
MTTELTYEKKETRLPDGLSARCREVNVTLLLTFLNERNWKYEDRKWTTVRQQNCFHVEVHGTLNSRNGYYQ